MADPSLNVPVVVRAQSINSTLLPPIFSQPYMLYVIQQSTDASNVAGKANQAGAGAYDAQVKNDEQDVILADHEARLDVAEATLADHETRITAAEATLTNHEARITAAESNIASQGARLTTAEGNISALQTSVGAIQADYVSKSATASQTLAGPLNVTTSYSVGGTKVIGPRQTGWTTATGTALLSAFNADQSYTVSATYTQAEIQAMAAGQLLSQRRIKALEDALRTHGLIN
ncbi:phage tail protein [Symbiopectobacterium purcellii]|uniref:Phage tail protein n=1 Tax=Symbiopectobacterium purcellii TaxID=2871826 RepID=A0ABX9AG24_9ENTR|nr:phage tail protein [Symbiopectobacterium purcellii]QZN94112.1 phage tail protein [Symbiopectobacterium purcellii]